MPDNFHLIEESFQYYPAEDFFDHVALSAHNCYQVSAKDHASNILFVKRLIANGHLAMIEHYRFLFSLKRGCYDALFRLSNPYLTLFKDEARFYVSLSLRPILEAKENEIPSYLPLISALPEEIRTLFPEAQEKKEGARMVDVQKERLTLENRKLASYYTYLLVTDRGVSHELVRHRPCSFAQESTRYCNYSKDKFGSALTFLKPLGYERNKEIYDSFFRDVSRTYFTLLERGLSPQEARSVLPNALKTSVIVTCSLAEWQHIFELRCSQHAHPDIRRLMLKVRDDLAERTGNLA